MPEEPSISKAMLPSAYCVCEAKGIEKREDLPGHLFFFVRPGLGDVVPNEEEEDARKAFEDIAMRIRIAFQKDEPALFSELFQRLLLTAQGAFSSSGFRKQAMNDLPTYKQELVQIAGGRIKARYNWRLVQAVIWASLLLCAIGMVLEFVAGFGSVLDSADLKTDATVNSLNLQTLSNRSESTNSKSIGKFVRWERDFSFSHTGFLMAASMWGLLFASMTRNLDPTFETLLTPDADLMEPWVRLLFFGIPILIIALVFQTQIVAVSLATVSTAAIGENVVAAILFGLLLGVAERALPKEVEQLSRKILPSSQTAQ